MSEKITVHLQLETAECPVCQKMFAPAPEHSLKIGDTIHAKKVCSYSCMRKWEKEHNFKRREEVIINEQPRTREDRRSNSKEKR